ncbi:MAG: two-component sensor kinase, involved in phosphate sensing, partial [Candidatus Saccharibacteria bacterium]|nr:two-component sensor kinase, involved in phosphate sensing [Candidatus Saccharibacteria bacterium]
MTENHLLLILGPTIVTAVFFLLYNHFWRRRHGVSGGVSVNQLSSALHDEKMKSSIIVNAIEDGVMLLDAQGIIRSFNPGATLITGWPEAEAMNLDYHAVLKLVTNKGEPYQDADDPFRRVFLEGTTIRDNA